MLDPKYIPLFIGGFIWRLYRMDLLYDLCGLDHQPWQK